MTVLVHNASLFGVAERGLWHYSNVGAALPRREEVRDMINDLRDGLLANLQAIGGRN